MKNIILTTTIAIAIIGNAFGAASVRRAVSMSNPTGSPARAGSVRATKTISSSAPAATTSTAIASISEPVATNISTDTRMSFLSGSKNKPNIGRIKDTAAAQQELNNLSLQIEELQSQISDALAEQSTVLTESDIDDKIANAIEDHGIATVDDTYTKEEIDQFVATFHSKLPQIDGKGNINIPGSEGTTVVHFLPYYFYANYWQYGRLAQIQTYKLRIPHKFGTTPFNDLAQQYTGGWVTDICEPEQTNPDLIACGFWNASGAGYQMEEFNTISCYKGFHIQNTSSIGDVIKDKYVTFENMNESQIREHLCGNLSSDACFISEFEEKSMGVCTRKTFTLTKSTNPTVPQQPPYYLCGTVVNFGGLLQGAAYCLTEPHDFGTWEDGLLYTAEWVADICSGVPTTNLISCALGELFGDTTTIMNGFNVYTCYEGFYQSDMLITAQGTQYDYVTFEDLTETEIREHFCGTLSTGECIMSNYHESTWGSGCVQKTFTITMITPTPEPEYYFNYFGGLCDIGNLSCVSYYETNAPVDSSAIDDFVNNYCEGNISPFWCAVRTPPYTYNGHTYIILKKRYHGYAFRGPWVSDNTWVYETNEDDPARYINNAVCGDPNGTDSCYVIEVNDLVDIFPNLLEATDSHIYNRYEVRVFMAPSQETSTGPTFNLMDKSSNSSGIGHLYYYKTNGTETEINKFIADYCTTQGEVWCKKVSAPEQFSFGIRVRDHGYAYRPGSEVTTNLGTYRWYDTNESNPEYYVVEQVCGNKDGTDDCYMTQIEDNSASTDSMTPRYGIRIFEKLTIQDELPKPYTKD